MDFSPFVIEKMKERASRDPVLQHNFEYHEADVCDMKHIWKEDHVFDVILDKGTFDAILTCDNAMQQIPKMMTEVKRLLKPNGHCIFENI